MRLHGSLPFNVHEARLALFTVDAFAHGGGGGVDLAGEGDLAIGVGMTLAQAVGAQVAATTCR